MNVLALYLVVSIFFALWKNFKVTVFNSKLILWQVYTETSPNLSTNRKVYASCVRPVVVHFFKLTVDFYVNM